MKGLGLRSEELGHLGDGKLASKSNGWRKGRRGIALELGYYPCWSIARGLNKSCDLAVQAVGSLVARAGDGLTIGSEIFGHGSSVPHRGAQCRGTHH